MGLPINATHTSKVRQKKSKNAGSISIVLSELTVAEVEVRPIPPELV
jgi:hypothetical protein